MSVYNEDVLLTHIPKCAGTSCRNYLLEHLPGAVDSLAEPKGPLPVDSTPLRHVPEYTGRPLDSWERIVVPIRNPYRATVSLWSYHWNRYAIGGRHPHDLCAAVNPTVLSWIQEPMSDWRVWYETTVRGRPADMRAVLEYLDQWGLYEYWIAPETGGVPDNLRIVHCEELSKTFPLAVEKYCGGVFPMPFKRTSPHKSDRTLDYLPPPAIDLINRRFRWTFDQGLYEMIRVREAA